MHGMTTYLFPRMDCRRVTIPETKNIVLIISPRTNGLSAMQRKGASKKGTARVAPNIVR